MKEESLWKSTHSNLFQGKSKKYKKAVVTQEDMARRLVDLRIESQREENECKEIWDK